MQVGIEAEPRRTLRLDQPFPDPPLVLVLAHTTELGQRLWRIVQWGSASSKSTVIATSPFERRGPTLPQ